MTPTVELRGSNEFQLFMNVWYSVVIWKIRNTVAIDCNHCSAWTPPCILGTTVRRIFPIYIANVCTCFLLSTRCPEISALCNRMPDGPVYQRPKRHCFDEDWLISSDRCMTGCAHCQAVAVSAGTSERDLHLYVFTPLKYLLSGVK